MTELHINSKTPKFDRRNILKGATAVSLVGATVLAGDNDRTIARMVAEYTRLNDAAYADGLTEVETFKLASQSWEATANLHKIPADTFAGVREKARWLSRPENRDHADFSDCPVLLSMLADIERLA